MRPIVWTQRNAPAWSFGCEQELDLLVGHHLADRELHSTLEGLA